MQVEDRQSDFCAGARTTEQLRDLKVGRSGHHKGILRGNASLADTVVADTADQRPEDLAVPGDVTVAGVVQPAQHATAELVQADGDAGV
ncbi:hypothetical protein D3C78_1436360 [compost metagenome]